MRIKREDLTPTYKELVACIEALGIRTITVNERDGEIFIAHQSWKDTETFTILPVAED